MLLLQEEEEEEQAPAAAQQQQAAPASASGATPVHSMTPEQYAQALQATEPITFAGAAATVASLPSVGAVPNPDLTDCILCVSARAPSLGLPNPRRTLTQGGGGKRVCERY